jgi:hypothetical protein
MEFPGRIYGTFYKYRSLASEKQRARVRSTIVDRTIYFARPQELNDPFDCYPSLTLSGTEEKRRYAIAKLVNADTRVPERSRKKVITGLIARLDDLRTRSEEFYEILGDHTGVYCLSKDCTVATQWAYYADNYRGICLEFTVAKGMPTTVYPVRYSADRVTLDVISVLQSDQGTLAKAFDAVITKSEAWSSEREVRALNGKLGLDTYGEGMLTGIVFGTRTPPEDIDWVRSEAQNAGVSLTYS